MIKLSKEIIESYVSDVIPLSIIGDDIDKNSLVSWRVEGDAANIRTFSGHSDFAFNDGVLITLVKEGKGKIIAEYNGVEYKAEVNARAMKTSTSEGDFEYLLADMHCHTTDIHEINEFSKHEKNDITDLVNYVKNENLIDVTVITDHADVTNDYDFFRGFTLTDNLDSPIILAGAESEIMYTEHDRLGILHRHSGELVTLMSAGYIHCDTYEEFEKEILLSPAPIGIFAHPHVVGYSTKGIWNFDFAKHNTENMLHIMRGVELGNGGDNKENLLHEYAYSQALDAGFRVSVTQSSDSHGPIWGYNCLSGKTVILAREKSREAVHDAFRNNRFYACESGNVKLRYCVNGAQAPATLPITNTYKFKVQLDSFKEDSTTFPTLLEVISDYGRVVYNTKAVSNEMEFEIESDSARYFYLKLVDGEGRKTWSMPVWTSREFDTPKACAHLTPIKTSSIKATSNGKDAQLAVNGDPLDSWMSDERHPTVIIEMDKERDISAIGYYPHVVVRQNRPAGWNTRDESKHIVSRFKVHVSLDGAVYTEVANVTMQALGCEKIAEFNKTRARFVKFEVLGNIGTDSHRENYRDVEAYIGNLTLFE